MLRSLHISNVAVVERLRVDFFPGLNIITGETGAGKSILVDAVALLAGLRASPSIIRTGESTALIQGSFELKGQEHLRLRSLMAELGIEYDEGDEVIIRREISESGRSRTFLNDQNIAVSTLRRLQPILVEIYGQGDHRSLLTSRSHADVLDAFGGCDKQRKRVATAFNACKTAETVLEELRRSSRSANHSTELLRYQLAEIDLLQPRTGEDEELAAEKKVLTNAERVVQLGSSAFNRLYEADDSALSQLSGVRRQLEELSDLDDRVGPLLDPLVTCMTTLTDLAETLRQRYSTLDFSPSRLNAVQDRLAELDRIKRKYATDLPGLRVLKEEAQLNLSNREEFSDKETRLQGLVNLAKAEYAEAARELGRCRKKAAPVLEREVVSNLADVALEETRFWVSVTTSSDPDQKTALETAGEEAKEAEGASYFSAQGAERVEFWFSANPGEEPRTLADCASGGELSRLILTLRTSVNGTSANISDTLVFDEVDAGIGGRVAEVVGSRLKALSTDRQVVCVTHQPQIARFADHHYSISKTVKSGRTMSSIRELGPEERVDELARMIGGAVQSKSARNTAKWLLDNVKVSLRK